MTKRTIHLLCSLVMLLLTACHADRLTSPNGKLILTHSITADGTSLTLRFLTDSGRVQILEIPSVGIITEQGHGAGLTFKGVRKGNHKVSYTMLTGKRRQCSNEANERTFIYEDPRQCRPRSPRWLCGSDYERITPIAYEATDHLLCSAVCM